MEDMYLNYQLEDMLVALQKKGCYPCVSYRGRKNGKPVWRAHINGAGNHWDESSRPANALLRARKTWEKAGCPMDGYAASPIGRHD